MLPSAISYLRYVGAVLLMNLYCLNAWSGTENRAYEEQRIALIGQINKELIAGGTCSSVAACQKAQILFASPSTNGIAVQIWGVTDAATIQSVINKCAATFLNEPEIPEVSIKVYVIRKQESLSLPIWKSPKASHDVMFRREK